MITNAKTENGMFFFSIISASLLIHWSHDSNCVLWFLSAMTCNINCVDFYQGDSRLSYSCRKAAALLGKWQRCSLSGNHCIFIASSIAPERPGVCNAYCYVADGKEELRWRILLYTGASPSAQMVFWDVGRK